MFEILPYNNEMESRWDSFIMDEAFNGTFLQTRKFLNYHAEGRFHDESFMITKSGVPVAAIPGNSVDGEFISHQGSTFGGPVISQVFYSASRTLETVKCMDEHLSSRFKSAKLKITAQPFCTAQNELLEYALEHEGYTRHSELSAVTRLEKGVDPLDSCKGKCRNAFRKAEALGLTYREINDDELATFYKFLEISKAKYNTRPVHTLDELRDLQTRIPANIAFRGIWHEGTYLSGLMLFIFENTKTIHFQYLAADDSKKDSNATTALLVSVMREAAEKGFGKFSWGISTEDSGKYLNENLYRFKESFGSEPSLNTYFTKNF